MAKRDKGSSSPKSDPVGTPEGGVWRPGLLEDGPGWLTRRSFLNYAGATAITLGLAACGLGSSPTQSGTTTKKGGISLIPFYTTEDDPNTQKVTLAAIDEFNSKHDGVKVTQIIMSNADRAQKIITGLTVGQDLGIFEVESTFRAAFVDGGYLYPLDSLINSIGASEFVVGSRVNVKGHDWVMPYGAGPPVLWGRSDRVPTIPKTFADFKAAAAANTGGGKYGMGLCIGGPVSFNIDLPGWIFAYGGDFYDPAGNVTFGSDRVTQALTDYISILKYSPPDTANWTAYSLIDAYVSERCAMSEYAGRLGDNIPSKAPQLESKTWATALPVGSTGITGNVISNVAVAKNCSNPEMAIEFLKLLLTGKYGVQYANSAPGQLISLVQSVRDASVNDTSNPIVAAHKDWWTACNDRMGKSIEAAGPMGFMQDGQYKPYNGEPMPFGAQVWGTNPVPMQLIQNVVLKGMSLKDAQAEAVTQLKKIISDYKAKHPGWKPSGA